MDQIDLATENEQILLNAALAQQSVPHGPSRIFTNGKATCLYCADVIAAKSPNQRWCDAGCRDAWQQEQNAMRVRGQAN